MKHTFRRIAAALVLASAVSLLPLAVSAQHDDGEMGHAGEAPEGGEVEAPHIYWTENTPENDPAFLGRIFAFALWVLILVYYGRAPLAAFLASRKAAIVVGLEEAKRVEAAAQAKHEEYTARIENLDNEIEKLRKDFARAGMEERDRMVAEASARANKMLEEAKFLVTQQTKTLREELTREAIEAAVAAAEKILRERATGADQQRLADEYLARLRTSVTSATKGAQS